MLTPSLTDSNVERADNPEAVAGAPSSIQVFTSRMRDEECLAAAEVIDDCFKQSVA
jgi:amidase